MDIVITSRLHAGLVAISHGIPAIMLKSTPKVQFLMKELDLNEFFVDGVINESIIDDILSRDMAPRLKGISKHMKQLSKAPIIPD
jgi:polysaccharide pyruvyl transferase WcaK-like protein